MEKNQLLNKSFALAIIVLFFGTACLPIINGNIVEVNFVNDDSEYKNISSMIDEGVLDLQFIYNITENLSNIIFTEYNKSAGELARGRAFGTKGEHKAAEMLLENMSKLGLYTKKEQIKNINKLLNPGLSKLTHQIEMLDYGLKINNETIVDFHITPSVKGPWGDRKNLDYNFSYEGLKVYKKPKRLFSWIVKYYLNKKENFVFIDQDISFNPDLQPPLRRFLSQFINPLRKPMMFGRKFLFYNPEQTIWYHFLPNCKGFILYDNNNNTYNQGSAGEKVPKIYINGTLGNKILKDIENASVDFYINQTYNDSVVSYNVIGQLNGTNPGRTVIVDSLYDSWWTQGTADAAIGMAMVLGVAKYFTDNNIKPNCTLKFIGFGGEEVGVRGAQYYEAAHPREYISHVIDLNQIGFLQKECGPKLALNIICNKLLFLRKVWKIAKETDYKGITKDSADIKPVWMPLGAPSNDQIFSMNRPLRCKTVCFLKDTGWLLHHRDGENHTEGDVMKYFDWDDVNATGQIVLDLTRHFACVS